VTQALLALLLGGFAAIAGGLSSRGSKGTDDDPAALPQDGPEAPPQVDIVAPPLEDMDAPPPPVSGTGQPPAPPPPVMEGPDDGGAVSPPPPTPAPPPPVAAPAPPPATGPGWAGLSAEEQLVVELINRARMDPAREVARLQEPLASGIPSAPAEPLAVTRELSAAARGHSEDMDNRDFFAHTNPDGVTASARAMAAGHGSTFVGENIGWIGSSNTNFNTQVRAEAHHQNLWNSDGHQRNLMFADWTEIGVGYDYGEYRDLAGSTFVTQMFGDRGRTYLTGVVIADRDADAFYDIGEGMGGVSITATNATSTFATQTWGSGGYSLQLPAGTYDVRFEGGGLQAPVLRQVTIGTRNVKLDVIEGGALTLSEAPPEAAPEMADTLDLLPLVPMAEVPPEALEDEADTVLV
jgi:uncharacterized protein YkwD